MYSKTRNTLSAFVAAALFVAGMLAFSRPVANAVPVNQNAVVLPSTLADADTRDTDVEDDRDARQVVVLRSHSAHRMSLSMPYFSFVQVLPQRRAD